MRLHPFRPHLQSGSKLSRVRQSGVVLIVVLIMLVVIGLVSAAAMRGALTADQISNNARLENLAKQAAQIALRYCEDEAVKVPPGITIQTAGAWTTFTNWSGTMVSTVPQDYMKSTDSSFVPTNLPQCMAEASPAGATVYVITARGFGPDYVAASTGATEKGAVIWLQSVISTGTAVSAP